MHKHRLLAATLAILSSTSAFSASNLIVNGGFETTPSPVTDGNYATFANSDNFLGWTISTQLEIRNNRIGSTFEGKRFAELDADNGKNNTISQTFDTVAGATYTFSFEYSNRPFKAVSDKSSVPASSSGLDFSVGSLSGSSPVQPTITDDKQHWNLYTNTFTATGPQTVLSFTSTGTPDGFGSSLDDVQVSFLSSAPVPEPGTYVLLSAGLGAIGLIARRRRRR